MKPRDAGTESPGSRPGLVVAAGIFAAGALTLAVADDRDPAGSSDASSGAGHVLAAGFSSLPPGDTLPPGWEPVRIPGIERHTEYALERVDGVTVLRARADAAMAGLARELDIDPHTTPRMQWRWRIDRVNEKSTLGSKQGDDFPARIYVFFDFDIMRMPLLQRIIFRVARALYGDRLPLAALSYVWGNDDTPGTTAWSPYTKRVHMVVASSGAAQAGQWVTVERNIVDDFTHAFGQPVPRITGIAIATDSDETGETSLAWYGDISFWGPAGEGE
jgi:Protein of unknown function (DUF3047)